MLSFYRRSSRIEHNLHSKIRFACGTFTKRLVVGLFWQNKCIIHYCINKFGAFTKSSLTADQRNPVQERRSPNDYAMTRATVTGSVYDIIDRALPPGSSSMTAKDGEDHYEHLNYEFSNPDAIDSPNS